MKLKVNEIIMAACFALALVATLFPGMELPCLALAFIPAVLKGTITLGLLSEVHQWHGTIEQQCANVNHLINILDAHKEWGLDPESLGILKGYRDEAVRLSQKCDNGEASMQDRRDRSSALKTAVGYCLLQIKLWAYSIYNEGVITLEQLHSMRFLLPGETSGRHESTDDTEEIKAEVKVTVINEDMIKVVVNQSTGENESQVARGWPKGVKHALIVIYSTDGKEVLRYTTSLIRNKIPMPADSRGKQFVIKAAFLRHLNDTPVFGNQPTFSMPINTVDLVAAIEQHYHDEHEEHIREVEAHRLEVERLQALLIEAQKKAQK
jgi:hypothetical protein